MPALIDWMKRSFGRRGSRRRGARRPLPMIGPHLLPLLLLYGADSFASNPERDGRLEAFTNDPKLIEFANAGHWLHHDQFDRFMTEVRAFL